MGKHLCTKVNKMVKVDRAVLYVVLPWTFWLN